MLSYSTESTRAPRPAHTRSPDHWLLAWLFGRKPASKRPKNAQRQRFSASVVTPQTIKWLMPLSRRILFKPVMKKAPLPCPTRLRTANWLWPGFGTMISPSSAIRFYRFYNFHQFYSIFIQCSSIFHCCQAFLGATNLSSHIGPISCRVAFGFAPSTKSLPGDPLTSSRPIPSTITCVQLMNLLPWAPAQSACLVADIAAHPVSSPFFQAVSHPTRSDTAVPQVFAVCLTYDICPLRTRGLLGVHDRTELHASCNFKELGGTSDDSQTSKRKRLVGTRP